MKKINCIIVNYQQKKLLQNCLSSLEKMQIPENYQLHVSLLDNSGHLKKNQFKDFSYPLKLVKKENIGFSRAVNYFLKKGLAADDQYFFLLNPDTEVDQRFLDKLLPVFEKKEEIGVLAPVLSFKRKGEFVYDLGGRIKRCLGRCKHQEVKTLPSEDLLFPDYLSGCCLLIKREVLEEISLFDERFFLYFEDADFCLRAKQAGWKIGLFTEPLVFHYLEEKRSDKKKKHLLKSNFRFIRKHVAVKCYPLAFFYLVYLFFRHV